MQGLVFSPIYWSLFLFNFLAPRAPWHKFVMREFWYFISRFYFVSQALSPGFASIFCVIRVEVVLL